MIQVKNLKLTCACCGQMIEKQPRLMYSDDQVMVLEVPSVEGPPAILRVEVGSRDVPEAGTAPNCTELPTVRTADKERLVYFARSSADGLVKIGFSTRVFARMKELVDPETGEKVELLGALQCFEEKGLPSERAIHRHFADKRVQGEWFRITEEDMIAAAQVNFSWDGKEVSCPCHPHPNCNG